MGAGRKLKAEQEVRWISSVADCAVADLRHFSLDEKTGSGL
jgi:hypothetical protein